MSIFEYLNKLASCGTSAKLPHFRQLSLRYGFEGRSPTVTQDQVVIPNQVHGVELLDAVRVEPGVKFDADCIYTMRGQVIGVATADCLPILIASQDGSFVMAVHVGWRGLCHGIVLRSVVAALRQCSPQELMVGLGPCISQAHYEVGPEVVEALRSGPLDFTEQELMAVLTKGRDDRWHLDLGVAAIVTLAKNGLPPENVGIVRTCTYEHNTLWYSFRRDGKGCGQNLAWIRRL